MVEAISDNDNSKAIDDKLWEYFENGVQVVWHIFPSRQVVKVYTAPLHNVSCVKKMICLAAPALSAFEMTADQIFKV